MQAKLLRVLQDGEYFPIGSTVPKQADVLLVAATNKEWKSLIEQGQLREDFFYRVCVIEIQVPPLRERKEDLSLLIEHFLEQFRRKQQKLNKTGLPQIPKTLPGQIFEALYAYDWTGNVRELHNVIQRYLATQHLDLEIPLLSAFPQEKPAVSGMTIHTEGLALPDAMKEFEKQMLIEALAKNQQHKINTAKMLGIPRSTLHRKIKEHGLLG
jgi:transcriptional regulator with PAS, ATPase and Fis domain